MYSPEKDGSVSDGGEFAAFDGSGETVELLLERAHSVGRTVRPLAERVPLARDEPPLPPHLRRQQRRAHHHQVGARRPRGDAAPRRREHAPRRHGRGIGRIGRIRYTRYIRVAAARRPLEGYRAAYDGGRQRLERGEGGRLDHVVRCETQGMEYRGYIYTRWMYRAQGESADWSI